MASHESGGKTAPRARGPHPTASTRPEQARGAWRKLWENYDLTAIWLLCVLAVAGFAGGWFLRPPAGAPAQIVTPLKLTINFTAPRRLYGLKVYSILTQGRGTAADLTINATGNARPGPQADQWTLGVQGFAGRFCTPKKYQGQGTLIHLGRRGSHNYVDQGTEPIPARRPGYIFLVVHLCWKEDPLLTVGNSYFSATLPRILVPDEAGMLTNSLQLRGTSLSGYSPSGGPAPTGFSPQSWSWSTALSGNFGTQASSEMPVFGASTTQIERDNHNTFYSGILFGIAAGAALSVIPALAVLIDRRKRGLPPLAGRSGSDDAVAATARLPPVSVTRESGESDDD